MTVLVIVLQVLCAVLLSMGTGLIFVRAFKADREDLGSVSEGWRRRNAPGSDE